MGPIHWGSTATLMEIDVNKVVFTHSGSFVLSVDGCNADSVLKIDRIRCACFPIRDQNRQLLGVCVQLESG